MMTTISGVEKAGWLTFKGTDAEIVSSILKIKLVNGPKRTMITGFPKEKADIYYPKLVKAGWKLRIKTD